MPSTSLEERTLMILGLSFLSVLGMALAAPLALAQCEESILTREVHFSQVPQVGGGDSDVFTKPGRSTQVLVRTSSLTSSGTYLTIDVTYSVKEVAKNNTHLERTDKIRIDAPSGCRIVDYGRDLRNATFSNTYVGEDHGWHDATEHVNLTGSYFSSLSVKFDGKGNDDTGNVQMKGVLAIPVTMQPR